MSIGNKVTITHTVTCNECGMKFTSEGRHPENFGWKYIRGDSVWAYYECPRCTALRKAAHGA